MTELHNMSVPPRTVLTVRRERLRGRRYRLDLWTSIVRRTQLADSETVTRCIRHDGGAYLLGLLEGPATVKTPPRRQSGVKARLRRTCATALGNLRLPDGFGFFVDEPDGPEDLAVADAAAIAILAARSGPLYLPGRFEPSLIALRPVTLFFPFFHAQPDIQAQEGAR